MKKILVVFLLFCAVNLFAQTTIPLSQSLNNIPTASTFTTADQFVVIQSGIGKKASNALVTGVLQPFDADLAALAALTGTNTIYYRSGPNTWTPVTIGAGLTFSGGSLSASATGSAIILDLLDDGANESSGLLEIAIVGDTGSIFTEPSADKLLINVANPWPVSTQALTGDSATNFFPAGQIERARGGTGSDTSTMGAGLFGSDGSNVFVDVDTIAELETAVGGVNILLATELDSLAELNAIVGVSLLTTTGNGSGLTGITGPQVAFADTDNNWTATNVQAALEELDDVINSGLPNSATAKVDWSQLQNVPAGFADGADDAGAGGGDADAVHDNVSGEIVAIADKATPVAGDHLLIEDSAASNAKKDITIGSIPLSILSGSVSDGQIPATITRDTEWDTVVEINNATTDDDFVTLLGAQTISGVKTWSGTGNRVSGTLLFDNDALRIDDTDASHQLIITPGSNLTANRVFTLVTGDSARTLTMTGDASIVNTNSGDVTLAGTPNYITISGQVITRALIDLASHVTGDLPFANLAQGSALSVLGVAGNATADNASIAAGADGDVLRRSGTTLGFGTVATAGIANDAVTFAKFQNITDARLLGRSAGTTGDMQEIQVGAGLTLASGTLSATGGGSFDIDALTGTTAGALDADDVIVVSVDTVEMKLPLSELEAWIETLSLSFSTLTVTTINTQTLEFEGATADAFETVFSIVDPTADRTVTVPNLSGTMILSGHTFTGDVTGTLGTGGTTALTVANDAVTFAKMQNVTTDRLLGRDTAASGDVEEITVGGGLEFTGSGGIQTSAFTGHVTKTAGGTVTTIANDVVGPTQVDETANFAWSGTHSFSTLDFGTGSNRVTATNPTAGILQLAANTGTNENIRINLASSDTVSFGSTTGVATWNFSGELQEGSNNVPNVTDHLGVFASTTSAQLAGVISNETGSSGGVLVFSNSPQITTPSFLGAVTWEAGTRQTFVPGATSAGINVGSIAGDPSTPTNGDLWYDSTANEFTARINGANVALGAGGGGGDSILIGGTGVTDASGVDLIGGAGVDITFNAGVSPDTATFVMDPTEVVGSQTWSDGSTDTLVWTFNRATGTDPTMTIGNNLFNFSGLQVGGVDVSTASSTTTLTNKTLDASATGNVLKFKSLPQFTSPLRVEGTNAALGTTATSVGYGLVTFSHSTDKGTNWAEWRILVPADWDTAVDPRIKIVDLPSNTDVNARAYRVSMGSVANSGAVSPSLTNEVNVAMSADAGHVNNDIAISSTTTLTSWGAGMTPGNMMIIRVARDGDDVTGDGSTVTSTLIAFELEYGSTQ